jgi:hypothetical protein
MRHREKTAVAAQTDSCPAAIRLPIASIKGKLLAAISMAATAIVALHVGIDSTPVHDLLPAWAWPIHPVR